jgi:hypothetical protein
MKLATFIDGTIYYHNIKKKFLQLSAAAVIAAAKNGVQKRRHFS